MKGGAVGLTLLAAVMAGDGAGAGERLPASRTDPGHQAPMVAPEPVEPAPPADHVLRYDRYLAYRLPENVSKWAVLDKKLSRLCQRGAFGPGPKRPSLYAYAPGITYGVGFAEGANLRDPQKQAKAGTVYFFPRSDTSYCLVFAVPRAKVAPYATNRLGLVP